jgi:hypothetical protein
MAISEKKNLLRGMYRADEPAAEPDAAQDAQRAAATGVPSRMEARFDRAVAIISHLGLYVLALIGGAAIGWTIFSHYQAGLAFQPTGRAETYVRDFFLMGGLSLILGLLATCLFIMARESLPRGWRWVALSAVLVLLPASIGATIFLPAVYERGRAQAFERLDVKQLAADAGAICEMFPQESNDARVIAPLDSEYGMLPEYTRDVLKPAKVQVYPRGVALRLPSRSSYDTAETIVIPWPSLTPSAAAGLTSRDGYTQLSTDVDVFRVKNQFNFPELQNPSLPPATNPWAMY